MRLLAALKKPVHIMMTVVFLVVASPSFAETVQEKPSAGAMFVDTVLVRPLYFLLSQGGLAVYGVTMPFTALGGNMDEAAESLVVTPLQATFIRCLGCGKIESEVSGLKEGEGKDINYFVMAKNGYASLSENNTDESGAAYSGGVYFGTHFELSDGSRYDVMVGRRASLPITLGSGAAELEATLAMAQLSSRFGIHVGGGFDLMFQTGFHLWGADLENSAGDTTTDSGWDFLYGVGVDKSFGKRIRTGLEFTRYGLAKGDVIDGSVNTLDVNFSFLF